MSGKISTSKGEAEDLRKPAAQAMIMDTSVLFGGSREVILLHKGEHYRLRVTRSGKLILTK